MKSEGVYEIVRKALKSKHAGVQSAALSAAEFTVTEDKKLGVALKGLLRNKKKPELATAAALLLTQAKPIKQME